MSGKRKGECRLRLAAGAALGLAFLAASPRAEDGRGHPPAKGLDDLHPALLAGRLERAAPPGGYVDVHGPLADWEAEPLRAYRAPAPSGAAEPARRARRARPAQLPSAAHGGEEAGSGGR